MSEPSNHQLHRTDLGFAVTCEQPDQTWAFRCDDHVADWMVGLVKQMLGQLNAECADHSRTQVRCEAAEERAAKAQERAAEIAYGRLFTMPKLAQEVCAAIRRTSA